MFGSANALHLARAQTSLPYLHIHADFELFRFSSEDVSVSDEPRPSPFVDLQIVDVSVEIRVSAVLVDRTTHEESD